MKFKFYIVDSNKKIISSSDGHFTEFSNLPEFFTLNDVSKPGILTATVLKRLSSARSGTIIVVINLCKWSSRTGGSEFLAIKAVDNSFVDTISKLESDIANLKQSIVDVDNQIKDIVPHLISERALLHENLNKVKKNLKELKSSIGNN